MLLILQSNILLQIRPPTEEKVSKDMSKNTPAFTRNGLEALIMARGSRLLNPGVWLYQSVL
jgi:hypothetical protein